MLSRRVGQWLITLLIVSSTAVVTLAQLNLPQNYWGSRPLVLYVAVLALSLAALSQARQYAASPSKIREYEKNLRGSLDAGLGKVLAATSVSYDQVGIHFFRIGGVMGRRLINIGSLRIKPDPFMIDPIWTRGKGVVGQTWKENEIKVVDWEDYFARWESQGSSAFKSQGKDDRFRLTWGMFQLTRGYKRIAAIPVRNSSGAVIGCVVVDTPAPLTVMKKPAIRQALHDMSVAVAGLGRPPSGWTNGWTR